MFHAERVQVHLADKVDGGPGGIRTHDFGLAPKAPSSMLSVLRRPTSWTWLDYGPRDSFQFTSPFIALHDRTGTWVARKCPKCPTQELAFPIMSSHRLRQGGR